MVTGDGYSSSDRIGPDKLVDRFETGEVGINADTGRLLFNESCCWRQCCGESLHRAARDSGTVYTVNSAGELGWEMTIDADLRNNWIHLALSPDGKLYISGSNGGLVAIE